MLDFITDAKFFRISFIAAQPVLMYLKRKISRVNFQFRNRENGRDSQFVFALQQVADRRQEGGAEVKIPDRRPQTQDGEEVDQDRLVVQGHGVIHGWRK